MSNKSVGNAFELKSKKYLEANGFAVDKARAILKRLFIPGKAPMFVSSPNDFLGVADLLGVHPEKDYTLFVQCFASEDSGGRAFRKRKLEKIPWNLHAQRVQLWSKSAKRGVIRVDELCKGALVGPEWVTEEFKMVKGEGAPSSVL